MIEKLVLGTVQLGLEYGINNTSGKPSLEKAFEILHTAYINGIRTLDTAEAYGNSQEVIGKFQRANPNKKFNIITKLAVSHLLKADELIEHISKNCKILGINQLYGYMFHNYESFKNSTSLYTEILKAKNQGLIKNTGISLYANTEIEDILSNYSDFDFIQVPFNLLDNELKRKSILQKAKNNNIEVHTRSVFLQGLFFKDSNKFPQKIKPLEKYLKVIEKIKSETEINTAKLALQYVLQKEYIDYVLIGVDSKEQLLTNINNSFQKSKIPHHIIDSISVTEEELLNPSNWN